MSGHSRPSDRGAAFTGLIVGTIFVIIVIVVINKLTNKKFEGHEGAKTTASAVR
jgi:multisubunit Na+/H+ antiporter MnhB subunit